MDTSDHTARGAADCSGGVGSVSVLTPSFRSAPWIERAISSVRAQASDRVEHIVCDSGSTDGTLDVLRRYPDVRWVSERDQGQSDAMNKAFAMSHGDIIVYLNADDWFEPGAFAAVMDAFEKSPGTDIVVGDLWKVTSRDGVTQGVERFAASIDYREIVLGYKYRFPQNPVSYFYRRRVQEAVGLFPVHEHFAMDYWFLLRAFQRFRAVKIDAPLGSFLNHGGNKSWSAESSWGVLSVAARHCLTRDPVNLVRLIALAPNPAVRRMLIRALVGTLTAWGRRAMGGRQSHG